MLSLSKLLLFLSKLLSSLLLLLLASSSHRLRFSLTASYLLFFVILVVVIFISCHCFHPLLQAANSSFATGRRLVGSGLIAVLIALLKRQFCKRILESCSTV